jgi:hypothetical protein
MTDGRNNIAFDYSDGYEDEPSDDIDYYFDGEVYHELDWDAERFENSEMEDERLVTQRCMMLEKNYGHVYELDMLKDCSYDRDGRVELRHGEYARELGEAIQGNTSVSRVFMDIHIYRGPDDWSGCPIDNKTARAHAQISGK